MMDRNGGDEWRESLLEMREGLNGELPRVAAWKTPLLMLAVAAVEETGFRYAVIGVVMDAGDRKSVV